MLLLEIIVFKNVAHFNFVWIGLVQLLFIDLGVGNGGFFMGLRNAYWISWYGFFGFLGYCFGLNRVFLD